MATYKVIQDIEAEDKLVGPLTLRQFVYAAIAAVCLYICFLAYSRNVIFLVGFFLPIAGLAGFFAWPWRGEQPTEIWALARLRFSIKPRVRIWDQEGAKDLVTVQAPKKLKDDRPVRVLTQSEVRSRLKALADTIDSRGWATRNATYGMYTQTWPHQNLMPAPAAGNPTLAATVPDEDMFDGSNSVAQNFDAMLNKSQEAQRQRLMQAMTQAQNGGNTGTMPKLPVALPNIPTPEALSAYAVAPAPAPMPMTPVALQGQFAIQPQAQLQGQPANNYWFANGPAYPVPPAPAGGQPLPYMAAPQPAAPVLPQPMLPPVPMAAMPVTMPLPGYDTGGPAPRIESDAPLVASAIPTADEAALGQNIKQQNEQAMAINYSHLRVLQPSGPQGEAPVAPSTIDPYQADGRQDPAAHDQFVNGATMDPVKPVTPEINPAILDLAQNDDLDIATIARQAKREIDKAPDEVEIRLH